MPWGRLGGGRRPRLVAPRGSSGELPPPTGSRVFRAGRAALLLPLRQGRPQVPCSRLSLLRPELNPPRSRTLSPVHLRELFTVSGGLPGGLRPPCPRGLFTSWFAAAPLPSYPGSWTVRPRGNLAQKPPTSGRSLPWASLSCKPEREHWVRSQEHLIVQRCCPSTRCVIPISQMKKLRPGGLDSPVHSQEGATGGSSPRLALALNSQPLLSRAQ